MGAGGAGVCEEGGEGEIEVSLWGDELLFFLSFQPAPSSPSSLLSISSPLLPHALTEPLTNHSSLRPELLHSDLKSRAPNAIIAAQLDQLVGEMDQAGM